MITHKLVFGPTFGHVVSYNAKYSKGYSLREYKTKRRRRIPDDVCCRHGVTRRINEDDERCIYIDRATVPITQGTDELVIILCDIWFALELFIHSALGFIGEMMINSNCCSITQLLEGRLRKTKFNTTMQMVDEMEERLVHGVVWSCLLSLVLFRIFAPRSRRAMAESE